MKIKNDFITNSSSTAYIVYLPKGFGFDDKEILSNATPYMGEAPDDIPPEEFFLKEVPNLLEDLRDEGEMWLDDVNYVLYYVMIECIPKKYILRSFDVDSSSGNIQAITEDEIKNFYMEDALKDLKVKEGENEK